MNNSPLVPLRIQKDDFINKTDYRIAYLMISSALSKNENINFAFQFNEDGSISIFEALLENIQQNLETIYMLSRAA